MHVKQWNLHLPSFPPVEQTLVLFATNTKYKRSLILKDTHNAQKRTICLGH